MSQDRWWEVYAQRAALDARALRALGEMPWPERRVRSLDVILRDCGGAVEVWRPSHHLPRLALYPSAHLAHCSTRHRGYR